LPKLSVGSNQLYSDLQPRNYSSATIPHRMNTCLSSFLALTEKLPCSPVLTAHMGSMSVDCRTRMEIEATQEAVRFVSG